MKFIFSSFVAALAGSRTISAISIDQKDSAISQQLAQTQAKVEQEDLAVETYSTCPYPCCPPALGECPGVIQVPLPCNPDILDYPVWYCNNGGVHTDWGHEIHVDACYDDGYGNIICPSSGTGTCGCPATAG